MAVGFVALSIFTVFSGALAQIPHGLMGAVFEWGGYSAGGAGALTVSGYGRTPTVINQTATYLTASPAVGATALTVASSAGFAASDEILIIQMYGSGAGRNDVRTVSSTAVGTINISSGVSYAFPTYSAGATVTQVVKIEKYTTVTVNSGSFLTVNAFNGQTGGVMIFKASGAVTVNHGGGPTDFVGGRISTGYFYYLNGTYGAYSHAGKGYSGATGGAGAGELGAATSSSTNGAVAASNTSPGGQLNIASTATTNDKGGTGYIYPGQGGGGNVGGTGGPGGGVIIIKGGSTVTIDGNAAIESNGGPGTAGVGAGGAGGSIYISATTVQGGANGCGTINANGGAASGGGAQGKGGRIFINFSTSDTACPANHSTTGSTAGVTDRRRFHIRQ